MQVNVDSKALAAKWQTQNFHLEEMCSANGVSLNPPTGRGQNITTFLVINMILACWSNAPKNCVRSSRSTYVLKEKINNSCYLDQFNICKLNNSISQFFQCTSQNIQMKNIFITGWTLTKSIKSREGDTFARRCIAGFDKMWWLFFPVAICITAAKKTEKKANSH